MHSITFSLVWIKTNSPFVLYYFNAALYNKIDAFPNKLSRFRIPFHRHFHFSIIVQWMWLLFLGPYFLSISVGNKIYKTNMLLVGCFSFYFAFFKIASMWVSYSPEKSQSEFLSSCALFWLCIL